MKSEKRGMKRRAALLALLLAAAVGAAPLRIPADSAGGAEAAAGSEAQIVDDGGTDGFTDLADDEIGTDAAVDGTDADAGSGSGASSGNASSAGAAAASATAVRTYTDDGAGTADTQTGTQTDTQAAATPAASSASAASQSDSAAAYAADSGTNDHPIADPSVVQTNGYADWPQGKDIDADYACLMDAKTGVVLYAKGKDTATPPASVTKIMTCLLALEKGDLNAQVTMTGTATRYATDGSSNLYTQAGEVFTLKDMLYGMMLKSANDMATQIGEYIGGGSIDHFVEMMNQRAAELGCRHTHFVNACGMPADNHVTTAYDMCLITQAALKNDTFRQIIGTKQYTIPATNMTEARIFQNHHNWVLNPSDGPRGFVGGKTGYTDAALNTLVSVVDRDGMELIAVTLHDQGSDKCLADSAYLFRYGYKYFHEVTVDQGDGVTGGGVATLPLDAGADRITRQTQEATDPKLGAVVKTQYLFGEKKVGSSVMTKDAYDRKNGVTPTPSSVPALSSAESAVSSAAETMASSEEAESAEPAVSDGVKNTPSMNAANRTKQQAAQVVLPSGIVMDRNLFLAMAVLSSMILIGIIAIIITFILRRRRN